MFMKRMNLRFQRRTAFADLQRAASLLPQHLVTSEIACLDLHERG